MSELCAPDHPSNLFQGHVFNTYPAKLGESHVSNTYLGSRDSKPAREAYLQRYYQNHVSPEDAEHLKRLTIENKDEMHFACPIKSVAEVEERVRGIAK